MSIGRRRRGCARAGCHYRCDSHARIQPGGLRPLGFRQFRVRHHGDIARIEIAREEMARAMTAEMAAEFSRTFKQLGFKFVTLDLEGFRSGSMNTLLSPEQIGRAG